MPSFFHLSPPVGSRLSGSGTGSNYYALDAAVAMEAYDGSLVENDDMRLHMRHPDWQSYQDATSSPRRLWSSEWYRLFTDGRKKLTWRDRFGNIPQMWNYYSSGEDILRDPPDTGTQNFPETTGTYAWVAQEKTKGRLVALIVGRDDHGGWGFNSGPTGWRKIENTEGTASSRVYTVEEALGIPLEDLRLKSFFLPFDIARIYGPDGQRPHLPYMERGKILAESIPGTLLCHGKQHSSQISTTGTTQS